MGKAAGMANATVSALNGMFGDYLARHHNGLAIEMGFIHQGQTLVLEAQALAAAMPAAGAHIVVLVHGLCCSEANWEFDQGDYGSLLQRDLGLTPFYVRYNTGLSLIENGQGLAALLEKLCAVYPHALQDISLMGHSMGGLLIRHACEAARLAGHRWLSLLERAFYIGTPHEGADLARFAHLLTASLKRVPHPVTTLVGEVLDLRSTGIKDLRHGMQAAGQAAPDWQSHCAHFLIAGTLAESPQHIISLLFGDVLVKLGRSGAMLPATHIKVFPSLHHMALAHDAGVYQQIKAWCLLQPDTPLEAAA